MVLYLVYSLTTESQILVNYEKCLTEALKTEKSILTKIVVMLPYIWYPYNNKKGNTTRDVGFLWFTLYLKQGDFHYLHGKYTFVDCTCWPAPKKTCVYDVIWNCRVSYMFSGFELIIELEFECCDLFKCCKFYCTFKINFANGLHEKTITQLYT